mgnify:CR=1 FL=1
MKLEAIGRKLVVELLEPSKPKPGEIVTEIVDGVKKRDRGIITSVGSLFYGTPLSELVWTSLPVQ